jgi:hypothetical protein
MSNDPPTEDCLSDPDRMLDALSNRPSAHSNPSVLRTMFSTIMADTAPPAKNVSTTTKQNDQRSKPKSSSFAPSI